MHHPTPYGANAYRAVGIETGVDAADPLGLVVMLYDGAIQAIGRAERHLVDGETEARGTYTSKAIDIVNQGLNASLDRRVGGGLAESLASLYEYMARRLFTANLQGDAAIYAEVRALLGELRVSWVTLRSTQGQAGAPQASSNDAGGRAADPVRAFGRSLAA